MDITTQRSDLLAELELAQAVVPKKAASPIYECALLFAADGRLQLTSTSGELALRSACDADVAQPGATAIKAAKLTELVRSFPDGPVRLTTADDGLRIVAAGFKGRLQALPPDDFPAVPVVEGELRDLLPAYRLRDLIVRTRYAVNDEDKRYFLGGAQMEPHADKLRLVTTDGHRLVVADAPRTNGAAQDAALVPRRALDALVSMLGDDDEGAVEFSAGERHLFFVANGRTLVSQRVDGQFPAYARIIPASFAAAADVARGSLLEVLRRLLLVSDGSSRRVALGFEPANGAHAASLSVAARSADVGDGDERVEASYAGAPSTIQVNGAYLCDFLDAAATERVTIEITNERSAIGLRAVGGDVAYRSVMMPQI